MKIKYVCLNKQKRLTKIKNGQQYSTKKCKIKFLSNLKKISVFLSSKLFSEFPKPKACMKACFEDYKYEAGVV